MGSTTGSTTAQPDGNVDVQRQFRSALSMFATGVAVITAPRQEGHPIGITVASFNAVSLDPPLILFSVDRRSLSLADLCGASGYAVNVLDETQQDMSNRFAKANGDKWSWRDSEASERDAAVLLPDALATFECEPYAQYDGGDHVIFVGRVTRHQARAHGRPLIFFGGRYRSLDVVQTASA
ncbi:p-hydroxyphenylacetate 3-hydroxylase, reductase component [Paraburkholderia caffeinitolerans]|uniref:p-hydroxyphenylacetate 3-hydroxylase, reductase component n=1 Tax=Paraburkholderia caffeinitolerans TaxID=1723730 RepID=A0A6J5G6I7_9BURK|nr:flavin reductase family protein [Paraburkholderia caffeinitolerans]CAB3793020.1 p-hydroxyphenylacetate 3-hydroxylase, reductase component [Paraburkholderia caffeinitolerans]